MEVLIVPAILHPLGPNYVHISRNVAQAAIREIMKATGIDESTEVVFPSSYGISQPAVNGRSLSFGNDRLIRISVSEDYNEVGMKHPVTDESSMPVFMDKVIGIAILPVYSVTSMRLEITYRAASHSEAVAWRDGIINRISRHCTHFIVEAPYSYAIPSSVLMALSHFHALRERVAGYGESFAQWIARCGAHNLIAVTGQDGDTPELHVRHNQAVMQGQFDSNVPDAAVKDEDGTTWTSTVTATLIYGRPNAFHVVYPNMIHNQTIDRSLRVYPDALKLEVMYGDFGFKSMLNLIRAEFPAGKPSTGIRIPAFDEWAYTPPCKSHAPLVNWMVQVNRESPKDILSLMDCGVVFTDNFLGYMRENASYVTTPTETAFLLTHYLGSSRLPNNPSMDDELNLSSSTDMDLREQYHARLELLTDPSQLTPRAIAVLCRRAWVALAYMVMLRPDVNYAEYIADIRSGKLPVQRFRDWLGLFGKINYYPMQGRVMYFTIFEQEPR
jgi:hypothetical protein